MSLHRSQLLAAVVLVAAALAGCSGSGAPSASTSGDRSTRAQTLQAAVNFSHCMRSHGVSSFPDPTTSPHEFKFSLSPNSPDARSPAFRSAATACQHLLPGGGPHQSARSQAQISAFLAFARCMRSHGFPSFPDPTSSGDLSHEMLDSAGINIHQPAVVQGADACVSVTHGVITKADVARFVAGQ
jgi:hypothetical protein